MKVTPVYYTYTDSVTGVLTKAVGWTHEYSHVSTHKKLVGKKLVSVEENPGDYVRNVKPARDAVEVTKEEYDDLDVSGESVRAARLRKVYESRLVTLQELIQEEERRYPLVENKVAPARLKTKK